MVKKILATAAATAVMTSMFAATAFAAEELPEWNTNGGQSLIEGDTYVVQPVIEVALPGELSFGINPLKLDADDDPETTTDRVQIISGEYTIANYSNVDVLVTANTKVVGDSVQLAKAATAEWDTKTSELKPATEEGKKHLLLVQLLPSKAEVTTEGEIKLATTALTAKAEASKIKGIVLTGEGQDVKFLLKKCENGELKTGSASGFIFDGAVDPAATFEDSEVKVQTLFTLNILSEGQSKNNYSTMGTGYDATLVK